MKLKKILIYLQRKFEEMFEFLMIMPEYQTISKTGNALFIWIILKIVTFSIMNEKLF